MGRPLTLPATWRRRGPDIHRREPPPALMVGHGDLELVEEEWLREQAAQDACYIEIDDSD
jgi:hypothetical protein